MELIVELRERERERERGGDYFRREKDYRFVTRLAGLSRSSF